MGIGAALWQELVDDFPGKIEIARLTVRLLSAVVLGGILGFQRAEAGKAAGMRTYMLVTLGASLVVLSAAVGRDVQCGLEPDHPGYCDRNRLYWRRCHP